MERWLSAAMAVVVWFVSACAAEVPVDVTSAEGAVSDDTLAPIDDGPPAECAALEQRARDLMNDHLNRGCLDRNPPQPICGLLDGLLQSNYDERVAKGCTVPVATQETVCAKFASIARVDCSIVKTCNVGAPSSACCTLARQFRSAMRVLRQSGCAERYPHVLRDITPVCESDMSQISARCLANP